MWGAITAGKMGANEEDLHHPRGAIDEMRAWGSSTHLLPGQRIYQFDPRSRGRHFRTAAARVTVPMMRRTSALHGEGRVAASGMP